MSRELGGTLRPVAAVLAGTVIHSASLMAGYAWFWWETARTTRACEPTGCEPQYYFGTGMIFFFFVLPLTFALGCWAIWGMWSRTAESNEIRQRVRRNVGFGLIAAPVALVLLGLSLTAVHGIARMPLLEAAVFAAPVMAAALAGTLTTYRPPTGTR